jgi:multisubunit Na+/H+ antiporter MnhB subunit
MKSAGILIILSGLIFILATSMNPGSFSNKVYNWSPLNGMLVMGFGMLIYIINVKIRSSEVFPNTDKKKQFYL